MRMSSAVLPAVVDPGAPSRHAAAADDDGSRRGRPIDLVHLSRQTFGDKRLETELLRLFVRQSEQILASLESAGLEPVEAPPACGLLHLLLGSARAVGATAVAAIAGELEAERRQAGGPEEPLPEPDRVRLREAVLRTNGFIAGLLEPM